MVELRGALRGKVFKCKKCGKSIGVGTIFDTGGLCEVCYKKATEKEISYNKQTENEFRCNLVYYKGGHTLYFSKTGLTSPIGPLGYLIVKNDAIIFISGKNLEIRIPINKIDFSDVKHYVGSRGSQQEAMAYAGAGMPWGSLSAMAKDLFAEIPFIDDNGKKQRPIFEFADRKGAEQFQKWLYDKMPAESEKFINKNESPLEILKIRYAKG